MAHAPFEIPPDLIMKSMGYCIWCGKSPPEVELGDEHVIPRSIGGHRVLADACCRGCEGPQSAYIGKCCQRTFAALRLHHGFRVGKETKRSDRKIRIKMDDEIQHVAHDEAPGGVVLPCLDLPRILSGKPPIENEFALIGFYVCNTTDDADKRAIALDAQGFGKTLAFTEILVTEFSRLLAHIAHGFYMSLDGAIRDESLMLPLALGDLRYVSRYLGGWPINPSLIPEPAIGAVHEIHSFNARVDGVDYLAANIRLFPYLRPLSPTYTALLCRSAISPSDNYVLFTRK